MDVSARRHLRESLKHGRYCTYLHGLAFCCWEWAVFLARENATLLHGAFFATSEELQFGGIMGIVKIRIEFHSDRVDFITGILLFQQTTYVRL